VRVVEDETRRDETEIMIRWRTDVYACLCYLRRTGWEEEDKIMEMKMLEMKRSVMNASTSAPAPAPKRSTPPRRSRPKRPKAPRDEQQITRVSPLDNPDEFNECCGVCFDGDSYDDNPILFCERCNVAVHQHCYGVKKIPEGDWFCKPCALIRRDNRVMNPKAKQCCLCTVQGGALKRTSDGRWAHLFCGQWIPELFISDVEAMEPIENLSGIHKDRLSLTCAVCKTNDGACVQCAYGVCSVPFHPMCALREGIRMEVRSTEGSNDVEYLCYCEKHVKELEKRERRAARAADGGPDTPGGEQDDDADDLADAEEPTPMPTPPPTPRPEVAQIKEEDAPLTTTIEKEVKKPTYVLNELTADESRKLIANILLLEDLSASDVAQATNESKSAVHAWLYDASCKTPTKSGEVPIDIDTIELALREWLAKKTTSELFKPVRERLAAIADGEPEISTELTRDGDSESALTASALGIPELVPDPIGHLEEYTRVTLETVRAPPLPKSVEDVLPDPTGNAQLPILRSSKCEVCEIHKRGICGTSSAVMRCLRRKENMDRARSSCMSDPDNDPDPLARIQIELDRIESATDVMKLFPDDEVVAEIYRAQTVLARQSYINKTLIADLLEKVRAALPEEARIREETERALKDTSAYEERWRGGRWRMERLRKDGRADDTEFEGGELAGADMCDPLVESGAMEDALCCVCAGGESEYPNEIVFCERCEMCVHQQCYGVTNIPEGEWLCWPCHETERLERENGLPGTRPPRYMREAGDGAMYDPRVQCLLCPVKRGALRTVIDPRTIASPPVSPPLLVRMSVKTVPEGKAIEGEPPTTPLPKSSHVAAQATPTTANTLPGVTPTRGRNRWCHVVCAHWQQAVDTDLYLEGPAAVSGLEDIRGQFKNARCSACRLDDGACIPCSATNCAVVFHPLCARRCGWHMLPLQSPEPIAFCARHSIDERRSPGSTMRAKYSSNTNGARFGQRQSSKKKRTPTLEEMDMLRRARVGLESLRLLCDRVVKREKIKRMELEQHHKLWLAQIRGQASGPVYDLGDDTQAHIYVPDIAKERKLLFLTAEEAKEFEAYVRRAAADDIRVSRAEPIDVARQPPFASKHPYP